MSYSRTMLCMNKSFRPILAETIHMINGSVNLKVFILYKRAPPLISRYACGQIIKRLNIWALKLGCTGSMNFWRKYACFCRQGLLALIDLVNRCKSRLCCRRDISIVIGLRPQAATVSMYTPASLRRWR